MTRNPTLVLGLGRTGGLVARELQALLPTGPGVQSPWFLVVGSPPPDEGDLERSRLDGPRNLEEVPLSMDLVRETMSGIREWVGLLPWLARYHESSYLDEIRPLGAAGYRSFARLAAVRSDHLIDRALRRALGHLREVAPAEQIDVLLIAGAGGGLGSALLPDLTFLVQRHARRSTRTTCLVLPPPGESGRSRFDANCFATICEIASLKAMKFPYEIRFESLPPINVRSLGDEPWQRVYCFEAQEGEEVPYPVAARKLAEVLALQLQPRIARHRRQVSQDYTSVRVEPGPTPRRLEKAFSTCHGLTLEFPKDVPGFYREDPITQAILDRAWEAFLPAFDRDLLLLRDDPVFEARKADLLKVHSTLWQWEDTLVQAIEAPPAEPSTNPKQPPPPFKLDPQTLRKLIGMEEAFLSIHKDLHDPPPALPIPKRAPETDGGKKRLNARDHFEDLNTLRAKSGVIWPEHAPAAEAAEAHKVRSFPLFRSLRRNMIWNLTERFATLQALVRTSDFRKAFDDAVRAIAHEWLGYRPEVVAPDPSFESWLAGLEKGILDAESSIFSSTAPQTERRVFALVLLPAKVPPGFDRNVVKERIEQALGTALQSPARVLDDPGDKILIYFEDLFHDACDLRRLGLYRMAYTVEPIKELFHTDHRFVDLRLCADLCAADDRTPVACGNPGCSADVRLLPATVRVCPTCSNPIRSRCGNPGCRVRDLHLRPEATARTCPGCGGLNHAAWWLCCEHGKIGVFVPIDKDRCPECIQRHHEDPILFPEDTIGIRPDLRTRRACWHCEQLHRLDPGHKPFIFPQELEDFIQNGVNGHERRKFIELARKYRLADDYHCPSCGTLLIPVDHRSTVAHEDATPIV